MKKQSPNLRRTFLNSFTELAKKDKDVMLLVGDVGFSYFEEFQKTFPKQFINCGVLEQTMMGLAAGLALAGKKPYVYSMVPFVTMRCYEQLRNDVCHQNANVKVVGIQGKNNYKFYGISHNIEKNEDLKILKHLPNLQCFTPSKEGEVTTILKTTYRRKGPAYIRL